MRRRTCAPATLDTPAAARQCQAMPVPARLLVALLLAAALPGATTILCLGDSLTAGYRLDEGEAYPALVEARARADGLDWRVINAGVSGDTTTGALRRLDWALKAKPDALFIALGGNDGLRGIEPARTQENLVALIARARAAGARPLLAGMRLPTNYGERADAFAAIYPALAREHDVPLLPFLLEGVGGVPELNQPDGIHPTADGQRRVAAVVYAFLRAQLAPAAP